MPAPNAKRFPPGKLCQLLNSFPQLGSVVTIARLARHRQEAGAKISGIDSTTGMPDFQTIDILKYAAWLCAKRHATQKSETLQDSPIGKGTAFEQLLEKERADVAKILEVIKSP